MCQYNEVEGSFELVSVSRREAKKLKKRRQGFRAPKADGEPLEVPNPAAADDGSMICFDSTCAMIDCPGEEPGTSPPARLLV